jgi:hypothetical protein
MECLAADYNSQTDSSFEYLIPLHFGVYTGAFCSSSSMLVANYDDQVYSSVVMCCDT